MSKPILATLTLNALNSALERDQGSLYRTLLREQVALVEDAYRAEGSQFRSHLGASLIGRECARELWLTFHWATANLNEGRMIRLFNRGHLEEARFVALLKSIGCQVWQIDENGKQYRILGHKGHFGGSMDGVVLGVPEMPDEPMITEFKTHGDKSFKSVSADGVRSAKFEHLVQMQTYMGKNGLKWALYVAVNKNDDELYMELVPFDEEIYNRYQERAAMIIDAMEPPMRVNESPGWYKCRFCNHRGVCHENKAPHVNCRTCAHSTPVENGEWVCEALASKPYPVISEELQLRGCEMYIEHPLIRSRA